MRKRNLLLTAAEPGTPLPIEPLLDDHDLCAIFGCSVMWLNRRRRDPASGFPQPIKFNGRNRTPPAAVREYIASVSAKASPAPPPVEPPKEPNINRAHAELARRRRAESAGPALAASIPRKSMKSGP